jgi:hypothetical protein
MLIQPLRDTPHVVAAVAFARNAITLGLAKSRLSQAVADLSRVVGTASG